MILNRHPADRLAELREQITDLEAEAERLRRYLLANPDDCEGVDFQGANRPQPA